jgi:two-component system capsular synthesis response regulator RcsB
MPKPIRISLLDDHHVTLHGLAGLLATQADFQVVGLYSRSQELFAGLRENPADVLMIDYALGPNEIDGVAMIKSLRLQFPASHVLVVSACCNLSRVSLVLRAGGLGYVSKTQNPEDIVSAIRTVAAGRCYVPSLVIKDFSQTISRKKNDIAEPDISSSDNEFLILSTSLTVREKEVLRCFLEGMSIKEIADKFSRSPKTISTQKCFAFKKLGIRNDSDFFLMRKQMGHIV